MLMLMLILLYLNRNVEVKVGFHLISKSHGFEALVGKGELLDPDVDGGVGVLLVDANHQLLQLLHLLDLSAVQLCHKQISKLSLSLGKIIWRPLVEH